MIHITQEHCSCSQGEKGKEGYFAILARSAVILATAGLDGRRALRGASGEETVRRKQGVGASFNLAAENCCNCNNIAVKESSMRQFKGGLNEIAG
ncbi:MAG: hypothetical protein J0H48_09595 [Nitrosospira multiformis]|nr:hypothetical protein [Nitrosospira multiformis]